MNKNKVILAGGAIIVIVVGGYLIIALIMNASLHQLPPENYTSTTMHPLKTRILRFANINNKLPNNFEELPQLEGFTNRTTDFWGNEIIMKVKISKVYLLSYGKDQLEGGSGDNQDVLGVIETKTNDGSWAKEDSLWLSKPILNNGKYQ